MGDVETTRARRAGGRSSRVAARSARLPENIRPVKAGLEGGLYNPISDAGVMRIHHAALDTLEQVGMADAPQSGIDAMVAAGAILGDDGRLRFPRQLVEDMLAIAARNVTLFARDPKYDLHLSGTKVHFGTAGAAVHMVDVAGNAYRESVAQDLFDAARIVQQMDNIHFFQRPLVCRDIPSNYDLDINTIYLSCAGTSKHIGTNFSEPDNVEGCIELLHMIAGGEAAWRARPFVLNTNCFVVPPMKFATESCEAMEKAVRVGMPVLLLSAGQAGATSPASLATTIVQAVAECLAGVVYINSIVPGHTAVFGTWPFVSDLRTGAMSGGSGEQALLTAGCAQMHRFYGLPGGAAAGIADAKMPDMQAGWEQGISNVMAGLTGLNMVYEAVGMHASLLGFCHESLVLGNDMIGQVLRCVRGIEVTDETTNIDVIKEVCLDGPGHYLGHSQTLELMQRDYVYPDVADRTSPKEWEELGKPKLVEKASEKVAAILNADRPPLIEASLDQKIRARFKICL